MTSTVLVWAPFETVKTQTGPVTIKNDLVREDVEKFYVSLSSPTGGAQISSGFAEVTITDDDTSFLRALASVRSESAGGASR